MERCQLTTISRVQSRPVQVSCNALILAAGLMVCVVVDSQHAFAQFVLNFPTNTPESLAALRGDPARVEAMVAATQRTKKVFETVMASSQATVSIPVDWTLPTPAPNATTAALAQSKSSFVAPSWTLAKTQLAAVAAAAPSEPQSEVNFYEMTLPVSAPTFYWDVTDTQPRVSTNVTVPYALALQLELQPPTPPAGANRIQFVPETINGQATGYKYQFFNGELLPGHYRFTTVLMHETLHSLGFVSAADTVVAGGPGAMTLMDVFRLPAGSFLQSPVPWSSAVRELRPTDAATLGTDMFGFPNVSAFPMSRGARSGGDGKTGDHFRAAALNTPPAPIGLGDPDAAVVSTFGGPKYRGGFPIADQRVLDVLGWKIEPAGGATDLGAVEPSPISPPIAALVRYTCPFFVWSDTATNAQSYEINIFRSDPRAPDSSPIPVTYSDIQGSSFCLPSGEVLAPGNYWWNLVGTRNDMANGYYTDYMPFTIACIADFGGANQAQAPDGLLTADDIIVFLGYFFAGNLTADLAGKNQSTIPDGFLTADDIIVFLGQYFAGC